MCKIYADSTLDTGLRGYYFDTIDMTGHYGQAVLTSVT